MGNGFRLGRLLGIEVRLDWSVLIIFALITLMLGGVLFPAWQPEWEPGLAWATAFAAAVLFLLSILLHELSHALVARRHQMQVRRITLFVFGGMAHIEDEPPNWRAEFWMAVVGPVTSLVIGFVCLALALLLGAGALDPAQPRAAMAQLGPLATLLLWLGPINILLGIFNLVPGFPLDGGRVLRALLWGMLGNLQRATAVAARLGQLFAWILIVAGVAMIMGLEVPVFGSGLVGGLWLALIGWFLHSAAIVSYRDLVLREQLRDVAVERLMQTDLHAVAPELSLQSLVEEHLLHTDQRAFPVLRGNKLQGLVCLEDVRRIRREDYVRYTVADVMTPVERLTRVGPQEGAERALSLLGNSEVNQLPVVEGERLVGLLRRQDLLRWLAWRQDGGQEPAR